MSETLRVLIVEDNAADADFIQEMLPETGPLTFQAESVSRLSVALTRLERKGIDLVFLDLGLPDSEGIQTLRKLREAAPEVPVIVLTGTDDEELALTAVRDGAQDYLAKGQFNRNLLTRTARYAVERQKVEAALRESMERLRMAQSAAHVGIWDHDFRTQHTVWTEEQEALFGFAPGTFDGAPLAFEQLVHPDDRPRMAQAIARALETGAFDLEFRATRRDGALRWFAGHGQVHRDAAGQPARMIGINLDITEHKRTEEQLREQGDLLDAASDAIYVRTLDHTLIYWNAGAERLHGWPRAEVLGRKMTDLEDTGSTAFVTAQAALLDQGHWSGELTKISKAGKELVVFCRWTLLRDDQGRPRKVLAINTDITEKKQMEVQFLRAQRMEGIGALAGGIAHDLNNILTPILMVGPLLRETASDPESQQMLNTVESCAQRGADIIKQLLIFARGRPGARAALPVRHLLNEMHKLISETFPRNIQSSVSVPKDLWLILGDATQIHQALMNLCVNARDALPDGGTLTLSAENVTLDRTSATLAPGARPGAYVRVGVTDTGTGIPPEIVDRIFDPFFTTKEIGKGTGLGLATVLGIVRGHGGFVRVSSRVGQGTTFELHLPASPEVKADSTPETKALPLRGQGELILLVDDEASVREITQRTLEIYGYRVIAAREGIEALALFVEHREIRAVLTDMMMPGMDGPKLVQALRQLDAHLPIVGMTGLAERAGVKDLESLNLPVMLNKPYAGVDLLAAISQVLAGSRPPPQAGHLS